MGKYGIKKEFSPYDKLYPPVRNPKLAGFLGSLMRTPRRLFKDNDISVSEESFKSYDGAEVKLLVIRPRGAENMSNFGELPSLVYFHGGGFFFEGADYHYRLAKAYAVRACCKVIFVQYRLAPKYIFPTAVEDCYAALMWTYENAPRLGIDPYRTAVGGDSVGGGLAAAVCQMLRDRKETRLKPLFQLLVYPVTDRRMQTESMRLYPDTPMWNSTLSKVMWDTYLGNQTKTVGFTASYASPAEATDLSGLPDAYVETVEFDCLRDEGEQYADALERAGAKVERYRVNGAMHGFDISVKAETTKEAITRRIEFMTRQFTGKRFV